MKRSSAIRTLVAVVLVCSVGACRRNVPPYPEETMSLAKSTILEREVVIDASIGQTEDQLTLVLIVIPSTSEAAGKSVGEDFVRLVKSLGPEDPPGPQIGAGIYDYLVGVYFPDQTELAMGAKVYSSSNITW